MLAFENRTSSAFSQQTLLTSFPAGNNGMAPTSYVPGRLGHHDQRLCDGQARLREPIGAGLYGQRLFLRRERSRQHVVGRRASTRSNGPLAPFIALQGGTESNAGLSVHRKDQQPRLWRADRSQRHEELSSLPRGYDQIPWKTDTVFLPKNVTCSNTNYQISAKGATLSYLLPLNAAQCFTNPNGTTERLLRRLGQPVYG